MHRGARAVALLAGIAWAGLAGAGQPATDAPLCRLGKKQSPVAVVSAAARTGAALSFHYEPESLRLANDGHTVRVRYSKAGYLQLGQTRYRLQQLHFHTPGGDTLDGEVFPMSAHVLHRGPGGQLLAVVVLFRQGAENPALAQLWPHLPPRVDADHVVPGQSFSLRTVMPQDTAHFEYHGSLTASPCTENVQWIVMRQPVEISAAQLQTWRARFADNIRGPQALHGREILLGP